MDLAVEDTGSGEAVVMIHGLGGSSNSFQPLMNGLSGFRVIRPDLPGSARSGWPAEPLSIAGFAEAVLEVLRARGIARAHWVGHSMGTLVCQHAAVAAPSSVASLSLLGALTQPTEAARQGLTARAASARRDGMASIADQIIAVTLAPRTHAEAPAAVAFVRESILRQPPEGYARSCEALARAMALEGGKIGVPTRLVTGDCDPVAPVGMARELADRIAGASLSVLDRCGHWVTVEQPQICARKLEEFLAQQRAWGREAPFGREAWQRI
jgi:3-oxoadipate enol-lactonase